MRFDHLCTALQSVQWRCNLYANTPHISHSDERGRVVAVSRDQSAELLHGANARLLRMLSWATDRVQGCHGVVVELTSLIKWKADGALEETLTHHFLQKQQRMVNIRMVKIKACKEEDEVRPKNNYKCVEIFYWIESLFCFRLKKNVSPSKYCQRHNT